MPRYFFDIVEPHGLIRDEVGTECADYAAMRTTTLRTICEIAAETRWQAETPHYAILVRDAEDREVYTVNLHLVERGRRAA